MAIEAGRGLDPLKKPSGKKVGAIAAAGAGAVLVTAGVAYEAGVFGSDTGADSGHVQNIPSNGQPDVIPGTSVANPFKTETPTVVPTATPEAPTATPTPEPKKIPTREELETLADKVYASGIFRPEDISNFKQFFMGGLNSLPDRTRKGQSAAGNALMQALQGTLIPRMCNPQNANDTTGPELYNATMIFMTKALDDAVKDGLAPVAFKNIILQASEIPATCPNPNLAPKPQQ